MKTRYLKAYKDGLCSGLTLSMLMVVFYLTYTNGGDNWIGYSLGISAFAITFGSISSTYGKYKRIDG